MKVRVAELDDKEVVVNINDLIIELLFQIDQTGVEAEKTAYRAVVARLMVLRDKGHKH